MPGNWLKRHVSEHKCPLPDWDSGITERDIWQCDCGQAWIVKSVRSWTDPRPGEGTYGTVEFARYGINLRLG